MNLLHRPLLRLPTVSTIFNAWFRKKTISQQPPAPLSRAEQELQSRIDELQKQLAEEQETARRQREECESATAENDHLKARLTQLDNLPRQVKELQEKLEQEKRTATQAWEHYASATADAQHFKERLSELEADAKRSTLRVSELEKAHADVDRERRSSLELLQARTNELREAKIFLTKNDDITESEVIHMIEVLNEQIRTTALAVVRAPQFRLENQRDAGATDKAIRRIEHYGWLGTNLLSALRSVDTSRNAAWMQTALQAGLAMYVRWLAMSWELGVVDPRGLLEGVYLQIREEEPQSVAGRWRALCRTHIKALLETGETQTQRLFKTLSGIVADVLVISGVTGTWESLSETIVQRFENDFYQIINLALQFQWTVGERIVSRDYVVFAEEQDIPFNPSRMEDERGAERVRIGSIRKGNVLCTTQLGLMSETKLGVGKDAEMRSSILLKPKVILKGALLTSRSTFA